MPDAGFFEFYVLVFHLKERGEERSENHRTECGEAKKN